MFWYLSLAAAAVLLILGVAVVLCGKNGDRRIGEVLILLFAATYVAYYPILSALYDAGTALLGNLLHTLRVISLDADFLEYYDLILASVSSERAASLYLTVLGILHTLLPIASVVSVFSILMRYFAGAQLRTINRRKRPLYVFSEFNADSKALAGSIRAAVPKCDIIFSSCPENPEGREAGRRFRSSFQSAAVTALKLRHREDKDIFYLCCSDSDDRNLNDALRLIEASAARSKPCQQRTHILLFSEQEALDVLLDSSEKASTDIRIISKSEEIAYQLLSEHPLYDAAKDRVISVLLVGLSSVNLALFRAISWCGQLSGYRLEIDIAGIGIQPQLDLLRSRYPALFSDWHTVRCFSCDTEAALEDHLRQNCPAANYIVVSGGSDSENLMRAIRLRRLYYEVGGTYDNAPTLLVHTESDEKYGVVEALRTSETKPSRRVSYGLIPFGSAEALFTYENLVDPDRETLSRNVHLVYSDIFSDTEPDIPAALEQYSLFEVNKRSNRANAMHIRYKLALLGLDYTDDPNAEEVELSEYLSEELLSQLARTEHDRWMAFLESEGWNTATLPQVKAYQASGLSRGRHNCSLLQLHPYICPFDELAARSEALGLPDSTVYDVELIRRIPDILHDRWNVSKRKYRIIRKTTTAHT